MDDNYTLYISKTIQKNYIKLNTEWRNNLQQQPNIHAATGRV